MHWSVPACRRDSCLFYFCEHDGIRRFFSIAYSRINVRFFYNFFYSFGILVVERDTGKLFRYGYGCPFNAGHTDYSLRLSFRNYFGPFVAFGFSDTPEFHLIYDWKIVLWFFNGLNKSSNEISLVINFFPMVLLVLLEKCRPVKVRTS